MPLGRGRPPGPAESAEEASQKAAWTAYLDAIAPYVVAVVATPLLDPRGAPRALIDLHRHMEELGITDAWMQKHVYLSQANLSAGRWWTLALHQLAHSSMEHLSNNIVTIVLFGKAVHRRVGTEGTYALLVGGATACGYFHIVGEREASQIYTGVAGLLPSNPFGEASRVGNWYNATVDRFAGFVTQRIAPRVSIPAIGASGGACCLMGASVVINLEELVDTVRDLSQARRRGQQEREVVLRRSVVRLVFVGINLFSLGSCFANELAQVKPRRGDRINHRSHVDGFLIGGVGYLALRYGPRIWARLKGQRGGGRGGNANADIWE